MNPRYFRMPVFKTGALGRYASPPWERLPDFRASEKSRRYLTQKQPKELSADLRIFRRVELATLQLFLQHHLAHMVRLHLLHEEVLAGAHH